MFLRTLLPPLALIGSTLSFPADDSVTRPFKTTEKWSLTSLSIQSDGHGPGPFTNTTESLSLTLTKNGSPLSTCSTSWTYSTSVNTVPQGWLPCEAQNLWFRIGRNINSGEDERFNFPPLDLDFLEAGSWQQGEDGKACLDKKRARVTMVESSVVTCEKGVGLACARHNPSRMFSCIAMTKNGAGAEVNMEFQVEVSRITN
jgi:hypothetical protein